MCCRKERLWQSIKKSFATVEGAALWTSLCMMGVINMFRFVTGHHSDWSLPNEIRQVPGTGPVSVNAYPWVLSGHAFLLQAVFGGMARFFKCCNSFQVSVYSCCGGTTTNVEDIPKNKIYCCDLGWGQLLCCIPSLAGVAMHMWWAEHEHTTVVTKMTQATTFQSFKTGFSSVYKFDGVANHFFLGVGALVTPMLLCLIGNTICGSGGKSVDGKARRCPCVKSPTGSIYDQAVKNNCCSRGVCYLFTSCFIVVYAWLGFTAALWYHSTCDTLTGLGFGFCFTNVCNEGWRRLLTSPKTEDELIAENELRMKVLIAAVKSSEEADGLREEAKIAAQKSSEEREATENARTENDGEVNIEPPEKLHIDESF